MADITYCINASCPFKDCENYEPNKIDPQELGGYCIFHDDLVWHNGYCENGCRKGDDNG